MLTNVLLLDILMFNEKSFNLLYLLNYSVLCKITRAD